MTDSNDAGAPIAFAEPEVPGGAPLANGEGISEEQRAAWIEDLDARLRKNSLGGHWQHVERPEPIDALLWRWEDIYSGLIESGEAVRLGADTLRRTVQLRNPKLPTGTTKTIQMSIQLVRPGERARAHRHTAQAVRFVVQGNGAYTTVEGERMLMYPNDLVLTPGWTWHDHANLTDEPVVWLDGLDIPLALHLDAQFQVDYHQEAQEITRADGASVLEFSPSRSRVEGVYPWPYPPYRYAWSETLPALLNFAANENGEDRFDGFLMEYANPLNGGHTLPTMSCRVQLLKPDRQTGSHRHTGSAIYHCIEGSGTVVIDGVAFDWGPRDCFVIPSWRAHRFVNRSTTDDAILYSMTDLPVLEALHLYREEETAE